MCENHRISRLSAAWVLTAVFGMCPSANAAGLLLSQLPADGSSAEYTYRVANMANGREVEAASFVGTVVISSVGQVEETGEKWRWIEMKSSHEKEAIPPVLVKFLVQERSFTDPAEDPKEIRRIWLKIGEDEPVSISPDSEEFKQTSFFVAGALDGVEESGKEQLTVEDLGKLSCRHESGTVVMPGDEEMNIRTQVQMWRHTKAPFGVVRLQTERKIEINGMKIVTHIEFRLAKVGKEATSSLPDFN